MSNLSQFGGGAPVGSQVLMTDLGPTVTLADNSTWMRAGTLATTASVPQLALLPQYKVVEPSTYIATSNDPSGNSGFGYKMASNGANIIISCGTNYDSVQRSTDGGLTWTTITTGLGANSTRFSSIVYANGRFVIVGKPYSENSWFIAGSTDGLSWTGFTKGVPSGYTRAYDSQPYYMIAWTGSYFGIALLWYDANSGYFGVSYCTTTDGTSQTSQYNAGLPFAITGMDRSTYNQGFITSNGAGGVVICGGLNQFVYSTNHGSTFTTYSLPGSALTSIPTLMGTNLFIGGYYYSNPTSATPVLLSSISAFTGSAIIPPSNNLAGTKMFIYNSTLQQVSEMNNTTYTTVVGIKQLLRPLGGGYTSNKIHTSNYIYLSDFSNVTYYGIVKQLGTNSNQYYVRIS